jgi:hypothetical protein
MIRCVANQHVNNYAYLFLILRKNNQQDILAKIASQYKYVQNGFFREYNLLLVLCKYFTLCQLGCLFLPLRFSLTVNVNWITANGRQKINLKKIYFKIHGFFNKILSYFCLSD